MNDQLLKLDAVFDVIHEKTALKSFTQAKSCRCLEGLCTDILKSNVWPFRLNEATRMEGFNTELYTPSISLSGGLTEHFIGDFGLI